MAKIEKIYQITLAGEQDLLQKMNAVNKSFDLQKKLFKEVKAASKGVFGNSEDLAKEKIAYEKMTTELVRQQTEAKKLRAETVALQNAKRVLSNEELKNQQATAKTYEAYQKLSRQYTEAKKNALGVGAAYGSNSVQFQRASAEAQKYYQQMITLNKAVGDFKLNVGNYPTAAVRNFAETFKQNFNDMKGQMASFALGYISFQAALDVGNRVKNDVIAFDSLDKSIEAVSERSGDYVVNQRFLEESSERLGLKILDTSKSFKTFFAAYTESGGGAQQARDIFEAAAESSANLRLSQEQSNGVMLAFGQIASKGKVQAEELRGQIGERIPGAFGIAAKAMGMTTAELDKAMSKGEIYSKDFLPKFAAELKKTYGTGGEAVAGMQAEVNRLDNLVAKVGSNKTFIATVSGMVTVVSILATTISKIPFSVWLSFVGLLTLAYWSNIQAMAVKNLQIASWIIRMGVGNGLIAVAIVLEKGHAAAVFLVNGAYRVLIVTMEIFGISTVRLRAIWISFNTLLLATPWGMILALIASVGAATVVFAQRTENATVKLKEHGKVIIQNANYLKAQADIQERSNSLISGQMAKIKQYTAVLHDNNASLKTKKEALQRLIDINPTYLRALTLENFHTAQGVKILDDYKKKLIEVARAKGAKDFLEQQYTKQFEIESTRQGRVDNVNRRNQTGLFSIDRTKDSFQSMLGDIGIGEGGAFDRYEQGEKEAKEIADKIKYAEGLVNGFTEKGLYDEKYMQSLLGGAADLPGPEEKKKGKKARPYSGSKLSGEQKDALADILASKDNELSELKEKQQKGLIMEEDYWTGYKAITSKYRDQILSFLDGSNAKERKITADQRKKAIDEISRANEELYNINRKRIEDELSNSTKKAENEKNLVLDSVYSTEQEKIDAENRFHSESYQNQLFYTQRMLDLNNEYHRTVKEETDAYLFELEEKTRIANQSSIQSQLQTTQNQVEVAGEGRDYLLNQNEINAAIAQRVILNDKTLTQEQQKAALEKVSAELALRNINVQLGYTDALIRIYELARESRKLTNKEELIYNNLLKEREQLLTGKASQENENKSSGYVTPSAPGSGTSGLGSMLTNSLKNKETGKINLGKDKKGNDIDGTEMIGYGIAQAFDLASLAMNNYFDGERQRIEQSRQLAYERIDLERQQLMRYSQSNAEREAIDKQAAEKKKRADKQAGEQLKKQKKNEAKIAFLMELANIWSSVWSMGNPIVAAIMGGALSVLAGARYAMTVSSINKTQYGRGGLFGRGGRLSGPSHSDGGMPVLNPVTGNIEAEMEGKEGIINAKAMSDNSVYSVTGTPSQIASRINKIGGGVDWFGGATLRKFESGGIFNWNRAQPPVFSSMVPRTDVEQAGSERLDRIEGTLELLSREGFKKVVLNPNDVTAFQKEQRKQTEIGTL